mgnify:CR=1 FL=1
MNTSVLHFTVQRNNPTQGRWHQAPLPQVGAGEVLLRVDLVSFTANNVTYAMFGERMKYWEFFPTTDAARGSIPVWGFADVVASGVNGVSAGDRFYGYYPMSSHLLVKPGRIGPGGFLDTSEHRLELPAIYNQYVRCSTDSMYRQDREAELAILRPLFATSFLLDDFLADNQNFGAVRILLSSASSKTAYGTAACLAARGGVEVVGLTSRSNAAFVDALGCYSRVVTYDELASLTPSVPTVYCDFAGNADLRAEIHRHCADSLTYSCSIGGTHWDHLGGTATLPGPRPTLFFAPSQAKKRAGEWGADGLQARLGEAWEQFVTQVTSGPTRWLTVVTSSGQMAISKAVDDVMLGRVPPHEGHVLQFAG